MLSFVPYGLLFQFIFEFFENSIHSLDFPLTPQHTNVFPGPENQLLKLVSSLSSSYQVALSTKEQHKG